MRKEEAELYAGKKIKIILRNNFHYNGIIISISNDTLTIKDKFQNNVSLRLGDIMIFEEVENGS